MIKKEIKGSIVALATPFLEDLTIDYQSLKKMIDHQIQNKSDGILILGTTGESSTIKFAESLEMIKKTKEIINDQASLIVGCCSNDTEVMKQKCLAYDLLDIDGILLSGPYYNKSNEEGIYQHFLSCVDIIKTPCILYNVPNRSGINLPISVVKRLALHPNIIGIKDASNNFKYALELSKLASNSFCIYAGNDETLIPYFAIGARGIISVAANIIPKEIKIMVDLCLKENYYQALEKQLYYQDLISCLFLEVNPIPLKSALAKLGLCQGYLRLPLYKMQDPDCLMAQLKKYGLI